MKTTMMLTAIAAIGLTLSTSSFARTDDKTKPVLLVHGWSVTQSGYDCSNYFSDIISALKTQGFSGPFVTVGYYKGDTNCTVNLQQTDSSLTDNSPWKSIAAVFSRYVNQTYTSTGQVIDVLGHSMGGLIIRGAVQGSAEQQAGFAPMMIEDAATIATPHAGTSSTLFCSSTQCAAMARNHPDIAWLAKNGNPQSLIATDWTVTGSSTDEVVGLSSALNMNLDSLHKQSFTGLSHFGQLSNSKSVNRALAALVWANQ